MWVVYHYFMANYPSCQGLGHRARGKEDPNLHKTGRVISCPTSALYISSCYVESAVPCCPLHYNRAALSIVKPSPPGLGTHCRLYLMPSIKCRSFSQPPFVRSTCTIIWISLIIRTTLFLQARLWHMAPAPGHLSARWLRIGILLMDIHQVHTNNRVRSMCARHIHTTRLLLYRTLMGTLLHGIVLPTSTIIRHSLITTAGSCDAPPHICSNTRNARDAGKPCVWVPTSRPQSLRRVMLMISFRF